MNYQLDNTTYQRGLSISEVRSGCHIGDTRAEFQDPKSKSPRNTEGGQKHLPPIHRMLILRLTWLLVNLDKATSTSRRSNPKEAYFWGRTPPAARCSRRIQILPQKTAPLNTILLGGGSNRAHPGHRCENKRAQRQIQGKGHRHSHHCSEHCDEARASAVASGGTSEPILCAEHAAHKLSRGSPDQTQPVPIVWAVSRHHLIAERAQPGHSGVACVAGRVQAL